MYDSGLGLSRPRSRSGFLLDMSTNSHLVELNKDAVSGCVTRLSHEIVEGNKDTNALVLIGIVRRGAALASRLKDLISRDLNIQVPVGTLDISSYRDDGKGKSGDPRLISRNISFSLNRKRVILIDDVLYTGRTVRAALEALSDLGRPETIQLAVLVDRGEREVPIRADYVGRNMPTPTGQRVFVKLSEVDGYDGVTIGQPKS